MAKILMLTCSRGAAVDRFTNSVSLFDILEELTPQKLPAIIPRVFIVATVLREDGDTSTIVGQMRVSTGDENILTGDMEFNFNGRNRCSRSVTEIPMLPVPHPTPIHVDLILPTDKRRYTIFVNAPVGEPSPKRLKKLSPKKTVKKASKAVSTQ